MLDAPRKGRIPGGYVAGSLLMGISIY